MNRFYDLTFYGNQSMLPAFEIGFLGRLKFDLVFVIKKFEKIGDLGFCTLGIRIIWSG